MENTVPQKKYWPYDEVTVSRDRSSDRFIFSAPWLSVQLNVLPQSLEKAATIVDKLSSGDITPNDFPEVSWLFAGVAKYPLAYIIPRATAFGTDTHTIHQPALQAQNPTSALSEILTATLPDFDFKNFADASVSKDWCWDFSSALQFSRTAGKDFDPVSLFSVARRFHLLNDLQHNKTSELIGFMGTLEKGSPEFMKNSALILRQNHYITQVCERVLQSALPQAQSAEPKVQAFIQAERGHDKLLDRAVKALGHDAGEVPLLNSALVLMELFQKAGERNLLAFSMIVDIFERTSYNGDPFAKMLKDGGAEKAAEQIDIHREINDSGGHENVALEFLHAMKPVSEDYALEAMKFCELTTQVIHCLSRDILAVIQANDLLPQA